MSYNCVMTVLQCGCSMRFRTNWKVIVSFPAVLYFSSSSASPYLTASSTLSLSASPLHAANHAQLSTPPPRSQQLTQAHFG